MQFGTAPARQHELDDALKISNVDREVGTNDFVRRGEGFMLGFLGFRLTRNTCYDTPEVLQL